MHSERWHRIQQVLDAALDVPREQRDALLDEACADDPDLRAEVAQLLESCERAERFLEQPAAEFATPLIDAAAPPAPLIGTQIGPYRILAEAGTGGMGTVYLAERNDDQYRKRVALKVARQSLDREHSITRFIEERQILASMEHPNIARLLDGGVTDGGLPYLVMEYVEGTSIDRYCDEHRLPVRDRLRLFCRICDAVQYAHRNLVVHRDLKPSNILVTDDGDVKLLDFGIARLLRADTHTVRTVTMLHPLTPEYASPEQVRGEPTSTASDVYSLGVLLYRLLTGQPPYDTTSGSAFAVARAVLETEPERPSTIVGRGEHVVEPAAALRRTTRDGLRRQLGGDLDAITLKALQKDAAQRYVSAEQLAADIRRHLDSRPVLARPVTFRYLSARFVRRNRTLVAAAALAAASLIGGTVIATWQARRATAERDRARMEAESAAQVSKFLTELFDATNYDRRGDTITARQLLDHGASRIRTELAGQPQVQGRLMVVIAESYRSMGLLDQGRELAQEALDKLIELHGEQHADVASALLTLGSIKVHYSEIDEAIALFERNIDIRRTLSGDSTFEMAQALDALGLAYQLAGRYDDAEHALARALVLCPDTPEGRALRAVALSNLGWVMDSRGNLAAADSMFTASLEIRRADLLSPHKLIASALARVSYIRGRRGDYAGAEPLIREAIAMNRSLLGDQHPEIAGALARLANIMEQTNRFREADSLYAGALDIMREWYATDDIGTAQTTNNYAGLVRRMGDFDRATSLYQDALRIYALRLGDDHLFTAIVRGNVAGMYLLRGELQQAESLYRQALQVIRGVRGDDDPVTATVMLGLGSTLTGLGRLEEAEPLLSAAVSTRREKLPAGHWQIAMAESALGMLLSRRGAAEAESLLVNGYDVVRAARGDADPDTRVALAALVEHYERTGRPSLAAAVRQQ